MHVYLKSWPIRSRVQALSRKMYATKRGVAMKVDEWENLKLNMYAIDAAISVLLQEK